MRSPFSGVAAKGSPIDPLALSRRRSGTGAYRRTEGPAHFAGFAAVRQDKMRTQVHLKCRFPLTGVSGSSHVGRRPIAHLLLNKTPIGKAQRDDVLVRELVCNRGYGRHIAAVPVHQDDAVEAVGLDAAADVGYDIDECFKAHRNRAVAAHVVVREAGPHRRPDHDGKIVNVFRCGDGDVVRNADVHVHRTVRTMLLERSDRQDHDGIVFE